MVEYEQILDKLHKESGADWIWIGHIIERVKFENAVNKEKERRKQHTRIVRYFKKYGFLVHTMYRKTKNTTKLYYKSTLHTPKPRKVETVLFHI